MIIKPKTRGFVCITSHPVGCAAYVKEQIAYVKEQGEIKNGPKNVLIIGASTGYGLASRITAAFGSGAKTLGVFFERPGSEKRPGSAGWYNTAAFHKEAEAAGLWTKSVNGDAFTDEIKEKTLKIIKEEMGGKIDLVVYSLAAPRRTDPKTNITYKSCLKPVGQTFTAKNLNTDKHKIEDVTIEACNDEELLATTKVMGGEDWELWMKALDEAELIAEGCQSVAYDYVGPEVTWPIYKKGTIGIAKENLKDAGKRIDSLLKLHRGVAFLSVNKALVTQASSAIPVVPLYISILYKIMKEMGNHEGCIEQIYRLFNTQMFNNSSLNFDDEGKVRVDDWEMKPEVQQAVAELWPQITDENLRTLTDYEGYQKEFLKLFGFEVDGVDYEADVNPDVPLDC